MVCSGDQGDVEQVVELPLDGLLAQGLADFTIRFAGIARVWRTAISTPDQNTEMAMEALAGLVKV